jgi:hypothetical protein
MAMILFSILLQSEKKRAKEHYDFIKEQYYKEIDNSIANTTIHACESIEARIPQYYIRRSWVI